MSVWTHLCGVIRLGCTRPMDCDDLQVLIQSIHKTMEMPFYEELQVNVRVDYVGYAPRFNVSFGGDLRGYGDDQKEVDDLIQWFNSALDKFNAFEKMILVDAVANVGIENGLSFVMGATVSGLDMVRYINKIASRKKYEDVIVSDVDVVNKISNF